MTRSSSELAAYLGEPGPGLRTVATVDPDAEPDFSTWAWGLSRWGQETMAHAALAVAKLALPVWESYEPADRFDREVFGGPALRQALDVLAAYIADKPGAEAHLAKEVKIARTVVKNTSFYVEEASGSAEVVMRRERALAAARAALAALEIAAWSELAVQQEGSKVDVDAAESAAQVADGPALHVVDALSYACLATGATGAQIRAELRQVLL